MVRHLTSARAAISVILSVFVPLFYPQNSAICTESVPAARARRAAGTLSVHIAKLKIRKNKNVSEKKGANYKTPIKKKGKKKVKKGKKGKKR